MNDSGSTDIIIRLVMQAVDQATTVLKSVGESVLGMGGMFNVTAIAAGALSAAVLFFGGKAAVDLQAQMQAIQSQTGATNAEMNAAKSAVLQLSGQYGQSTSEMAAGMSEVERSGYSMTGALKNGATAMDVLTQAARLAVVAHASVAQSADLLMAVMQSEIGGFNGVGQAAAIMNGILGTGRQTIDELSSSIGSGILAVFKSAGLTINDFAASVALLGQNGMAAETSSMRLIRAIQMMESPTTTATKALTEIHLTAAQLTDDLHKPDGLVVALQDLKTHLEDAGFTAQTWAPIIGDIFGKSKGSTVPTLLLEQLTQLSALYKQQGQEATKWQSDWQSALDSVQVRWARFWETMKDIATTLAGALLPVLGAVLAVLLPFAEGVGKLLTVFPLLTAVMMAALAGFAALNLAVIGGKTAVAAYEFAMRNVFAVISHEGAIMNSGINLFRNLTGAQLEGVTAAQLAARSAKEQEAAQALLNARTAESNVVTDMNAVKTAIAADKHNLLAIAMKGGLSVTDATKLAEESLSAERQLESATLTELTAKEALLSLGKKADADETAYANAQETLRVATLERVSAQVVAQAADNNILNASNKDVAASSEMMAAKQKLSNDQLTLSALGIQKQALATDVASARSKILSIEQEKLAASIGTTTVATGAETGALEGLTVAETEAAAAADALAASEKAASFAGGMFTDVLGILMAGGLITLLPAVGILAYAAVPDFRNAVNGAVLSLINAGQASGDATNAFGLLEPKVQSTGQKLQDASNYMNDVAKTQVAMGVQADALNPKMVKLADSIVHLSQVSKQNQIEFTGEAAGYQATAEKADKLAAALTGLTNAEAQDGKLRLAESQKEAEAFSAAYAKQQKSIKDVGAALIDYERLFAEVNASAIATIDKMTQDAENKMSAWADSTVASAKRMSDGVIAEINRVKDQLAQPMPEMKLINTPAQTNQGIASANLTQTNSSTMVLNLAPGAEAGLKAFNASLGNVPKEFQGAFDASVTNFDSKLTDSYNTYVGKYNAENTRHEGVIKTDNDNYLSKLKADRDAAQQKMDAENQRYLQALSGLNQTHEDHLQSILQNFETTFQTDLANYQAKQSELQSKMAADLQTHRDALNAMESARDAKLQSINDEAAKKGAQWVADQKKALLEAYNRQVGLENQRYQNQINADTRNASNMDSAFNRQINALDAQAQNKVDAEKRAYDDALTKLAVAHRLHETNIEKSLQAHVAKLKETLDKAIVKEDGLYERHIKNLYDAFEHHAKLLGDALSKGVVDPGKVLSAIDKGTQDAYNKALEKATMDQLMHGKATEADIDALKRAAAERDKLTKAEADVQKMAGTSKTAKGPTFSGVISAEDKVVQEQTKLIAARVDVLKDINGLAVNKIDQVTSAIKSQTEIVTRMSDVGTAAADGQVKAIQDASSVAKAQYALSQATNPQEVALAQAQLTQAQDNQAADAAISAANLQVANDQLKEAQDAATNAAIVGAAHTQVLQDQLRLENDKVRLQQAELQTAKDQLAAQGNIEKAITGSSDAQKKVLEDQTRVELDNTKIANDQKTLQIDTGKEAIANANANQQAANDALTTANDKAVAVALDNGAKIQAAKDQAHTDALSQVSKQSTDSAKDASTVINAQDKIVEEQTKLIASNTDVMKANSDLMVAGLDALTTAIDDQTKIIASEESVAKARTDGQVKAIEDQSAIYKAQTDIANATDAQALAVAQAQLKSAQDKMHFDMMIASAQVAVAQQQVQADMDKARFDVQDAQMKQVVLQDTLAVDLLKVTLQQDQIQLAMDQLKALGDIAAALGAQTDVEQAISADEQKITQDNAAIAKAQAQMAIDQAALAAQEAQAKVQEAQDTQNVELAKQAQANIENQAAITEAMDKAHEDALSAQKATAASASDIIKALQDTNQELRNDLAKLLEIESLGAAGLSRLNVAGAAPGTNILNGWASDSARQAGAPT